MKCTYSAQCMLQLTVWGAREQKECYDGEVFLWQLEGESKLTRGNGSVTVLKEDHCLIIPPGERCVAYFLI